MSRRFCTCFDSFGQHKMQRAEDGRVDRVRRGPCGVCACEAFELAPRTKGQQLVGTKRRVVHSLDQMRREDAERERESALRVDRKERAAILGRREELRRLSRRDVRGLMGAPTTERERTSIPPGTRVRKTAEGTWEPA